MTEIMLRDAGTAHDLRYVILRYFNVAGADPNCRTGQSTKNAIHLIKIRRRTVLVFVIIGTSTTLSARMRTALFARRRCFSGGVSVMFNCGYGHGFGVREVVEMVKRVSGVDFKVRSHRADQAIPHDRCSFRSPRAMLGWTPQYDNLAIIIAHALAWEQRLRRDVHGWMMHVVMGAGCEI